MRMPLYKITFTRDKAFWAHVLIWTIFIVYEIVVTRVGNGRFHPLLQYVLFYGINIGVFYIQADWVLPREGGKRGGWGIVLLLSSMLLLVYCILATGNIKLIHSLLENDRIYTADRLDYTLYAGFVYRALYFMLLGTGYYYLMKYIRSKQREARQQAEIDALEKRLLQAELAFLRAQVNPHLLFNTLAFIQEAAKTRPDQAEEAMQCLSRLMGFALSEHKHDGVALREEIQQAENIIRIQQLRYGDSLKLDYTKEILHDRAIVLPLTFVSLVENLFKHGHPANARVSATIRVYGDRHRVCFETSNLPRTMGPSRQKHAPSGLRNIRERLEKAVPGRFIFEHGMDGEIFKTRLEIRYENE